MSTTIFEGPFPLVYDLLDGNTILHITSPEISMELYDLI